MKFEPSRLMVYRRAREWGRPSFSVVCQPRQRITGWQTAKTDRPPYNAAKPQPNEIGAGCEGLRVLWYNAAKPQPNEIGAGCEGLRVLWYNAAKPQPNEIGAGCQGLGVLS
jgi:hypothetical protein